MTHILSRHQITELRDLARSSSARHETRTVVVEGTRAIKGAYLAGAHINRILAVDSSPEIHEFSAEVVLVDQKTIDRIATTSSPQGSLAICDMPVTYPQQLGEEPIASSNIFILDNVSDPGNVGTIIRSAVAFSIGAVVMVGGCDPFHPKVIRSSAGSIFAMDTLVIDEFEIPSAFSGRSLYAADAHSDVDMSGFEFPVNAAVVFGNEAHGITTEYFLNNAETFVIHMAELCESLNVAMTATIVAHHLATQ